MIRPQGMASSTASRLRHRDEPAFVISASSRAKAARPQADGTPVANPLPWLVPAIGAAMAGLMVLAWNLHEARHESARLNAALANMRTLARAVLDDAAVTKGKLNDANEDKETLYRSLENAGRTQTKLREDVHHWRSQHDQALLTTGEQVREWSAYGTTLKLSLDSESSQRQAAEQNVTLLHTETQKLASEKQQAEEASRNLASEAAQMQQCILRLRSENSALCSEIDRLKSCLSSLQGENSALHSRISCLQSENSNLASCNSRLQSEIGCLQSRISCLESKLAGRECERDHRR